jgi:hypothetical protein
MAKGDLFDFGDPFDAQRRDLDGKFIDGPKPMGLWDVPKGGDGWFDMPKPKELQGIEKLGQRLDGPRKGGLTGVQTWGKPVGHRSRPEKRGVGDAIGVIVIVVIFVAVALYIYG